MKISKKGIDNITNQNMVDFDLDNSGGHLFTVLSELYSKPEESTLRELATNATDAHIMSNNQDRPFIIKLPNFEKNIFNFAVRDFGPGLTHDQVINIYKVYGRSTKTESDEETGCLGLGSKSPFSISSTFYVKSFKDGICSQYTCSMGNNGIPRITETPIQFETYEENGLEVIVPIYKEFDFEKIIADTLKYFKVKPIVYIQNKELESPTQLDISWPKKKDSVFITDTIALNIDRINLDKLVDTIKSKRGTAEVIQLQIFYPLDRKMIMDTISRFNKLYSNEDNNIISKFKISNDIIKTIEHLFDIGFQLHSKPGRIAFAPSRETIKYNELTLIYIIKELIYAARTVNKILERKYSNIKTFSDCYNKIFIDNHNFVETSKYFNCIRNLPTILNSEKIFEKEQPVGNFLTNILNLHTLKKGIVNSNFSGHMSKKISLRTITSKNYISDKGMVFRYINIWDTNRLHFRENMYNKMLFSFCTPFMDIFIRSMYRKIYYINIDFYYKRLTSYITDLILHSNDKDFMELPIKYINVPLISKNIFEDMTVDIKERRQKTFDAIIKNLESKTVFEINTLDRINKIKKAEDSSLKNIFDKLSSLENIFLSGLEKDDLNTSISIIDCLKNIDTIKVKPFNINKLYIEIAKIFAKMYLTKERTKNKFNELLKYNVYDIKEFFFHYEKRQEDDKYHLLDAFFNLKSDVSTSTTILSEYIIYYLFYLYPKEVENQVAYEKSDFIPFVKNWLLEKKLPIEHTLDIKPVEKFKFIGTRAQKKLTGNVEHVMGNIYYYDFEINDELFNKFGNIIREILEETELIFDTYINVYNDLHINKKSLNDLFSEYLDWMKGFRKFIKIDIMNEQNNLIKYNKYLYLIYQIKSMYSKLKTIITDYNSKFRTPELTNIYNKQTEFMNLLNDLVISINYFDNKYTLFSVYFDNFQYVSIPDYLLNKEKLDLKSEYLFDKREVFKCTVLKREKNLERFINENEVCNLAEFKVNYGKDFQILPEHIGLERAEEYCKYINKTWELNSIQKKLTDAKTRKYRNALMEESSSSLTSYLEYVYPNIKFIKVENIPTKLKKNLINPISIVLKTYYLKNYNEIKIFDTVQEIQTSNQNYLLPGQIFESISYMSPGLDYNVSTNELFLLLNEKEKMAHYEFFIKVIQPWTKKYKRFESKYKDFITLRMKAEPIIRRILRLSNLEVITDKIENEGLTLTELLKMDENKVKLKYGKSSVHYSVKNLCRNIDKFCRSMSSSLFSFQSAEKLNEEFEKEIFEEFNKNSDLIKIKEFYKKNWTFVNLLEELDSFLRYSKRENKFNSEELLKKLKSYFAPKKTSIVFSNWENFMETHKKMDAKKIMHYKINKRS